MSLYHIIYKTINLKNDKYYIGKHSTDNIDDGYLGSGVVLKKAIEKNGRTNFKREVLHIFENESDAYAMEAKLVNGGAVDDSNCYNIKIGGEGGLSDCETHWMRVVTEYASVAHIILTRSIDSELYEKINYAEDPMDYINIDSAVDIAEAMIKHSGEAFSMSMMHAYPESHDDLEDQLNIRKRVIALNYFSRQLTGFKSYPEYCTWASMIDIEEVNLDKILLRSGSYDRCYVDDMRKELFSNIKLDSQINELKSFENSLGLSYGN